MKFLVTLLSITSSLNFLTTQADNGDYGQTKSLLYSKSTLHYLLDNGWSESAKKLITLGILDINAVDEKGVTVIEYAAGAGDINMVQFLLEQKDHVMGKNEALFQALRNKNYDIVNLLLKNGAYNSGFMKRAVQWKDIGLVAAIIRRCPNDEVKNFYNNESFNVSAYDKTALGIASILLSHGAIPPRDEMLIKQLIYSFYVGADRLAMYFIAYGAKLVASDLEFLLEQLNFPHNPDLYLLFKEMLYAGVEISDNAIELAIQTNSQIQALDVLTFVKALDEKGVSRSQLASNETFLSKMKKFHYVNEVKSCNTFGLPCSFYTTEESITTYETLPMHTSENILFSQ
jgi:hypothetical protein